MNRTAFSLLAAALVLLPAGAAHAQRRACISDAEIEAALGPQVRSGALLIDASAIDDGRPLCTGGTIARRIHRMREDAHPEERAERLDREDRVRADIARTAAREEADRAAERTLMLLEREARAAAARRDAAIAARDAAEARAGAGEADLRAARARAGLAEAELREAQARQKLAALPVVALAALDTDRLARDLDALLRADDDFWIWKDDYLPGSVRGIDATPFDASQRNLRISAAFTYRSSGDAGRVEVMYLQGEVSCMRVQGPLSREAQCRKPGDPESIRLAGGLLETAMNLLPTLAEYYLRGK